MSIAIFYDTETTGLPLYGERSDDPRQPHIVQLAAAMVDLRTRKTIQSINLIVRPDGWEIPKETSDIHGITHEKAMDVGVPEKDVTSIFHHMVNQSDWRIAHNDAFDAKIIRIASKRFFPALLADKFKEAEKYCTMHKSTALVCAPPSKKMLAAGRTGFKVPNLSEAYKHFTGSELVGAHDAMIDVDACIAVYFGIKDHELPDVPF